MATLKTSNVLVQQFASALYGIQLGSTTMNAVLADATRLSADGSNGLDRAFNAYYANSFGGMTNTAVANTVVANLGITGAAATAAAAYIANQLAAATPTTKGAVINNVLNVFSNATADATYGAAATAWNTKVTNAVAYSASNTADVAAGTAVAANFTLTTGVDNIVGGTGDDYISAARSVGTNNGMADTLNSFDSIDGGAGTNTLFVQGTGAATTAPNTFKNIQKLTVESTGGAYVVDLANGDSATKTLTIQNSTGAANTVTVQNNTSALTNLNLSNVSAAVVAGSIASAVAGTSDSLAVSLSSVTGAQNVTVNGYETLTLASNGTVANAPGVVTDTSLRTLTVTGAQDLTLTLGVNTNATTIDASAATGRVNVTVSAASGAQTITGGSANDTINMVGAGATNTYTVADTINGGAGTDTLTLLSAAIAGATVAQANVSNIETIALSGAAAGGATYTINNFGATALTFDGTATAGLLNVNFAAGTNSVNLGASTGGGALTITTAGVATTDTLNLTMGNALTPAGNLFGAAITSTGAETVNLTTQGGAISVTAFTMTNTAANEALVISGNQSFTVVGAGAITADTINASGMTAAFVMGTGATVAASGAAITGGSAGDTLTGSAQGDIISGGAGNDTITALAGADTLTGGAGNDTFTYSAVAQGGNVTIVASGTVMTAGDLITDFTSGADQVNVTAGTTTAAVGTGLAGAWNLGTSGLYILTGSNLTFTAGTTTAANVAAVIGNVTSAAGTDTGYIAILDTRGTAATTDDVYNIFEVVTASGAKAGAALATTDTISLVGTLSTNTITAADFVA